MIEVRSYCRIIWNIVKENSWIFGNINTYLIEMWTNCMELQWFPLKDRLWKTISRIGKNHSNRLRNLNIINC